MNSLPTLRTCAFRSRRPSILLRPVIGVKRAACRTYADNNSAKLPEAQNGQAGPNMQQQEHVSEEAAKMAKIQGGKGPDMEAGTPVQEVSSCAVDVRRSDGQRSKERVLTSGLLSDSPRGQGCEEAGSAGVEGSSQEW